MHVIHGPEGVNMHPRRDLWEWYYIVPWTPLIKNQDVNNQYFRFHLPFWMILKMAATKNGKILIKVNISPISSLRLVFF